MTDQSKVGPWVRRFLLEHLVADRNLSRNTQKSYRDTLALLLPFAAASASKAIDQLTVEHLTADVVRAFLQHIQETRSCCVATRNQRLAAIHALARFVAEHSPEHIAWCGSVRSIPFKNSAQPHISYLDKPEIDALLLAAKGDSVQARRDYALLLFLYNSGARAGEAATLAIGNLELRAVAGSQQHVVRVFGKGSKTRYCPLWPATAQALTAITSGRGKDEPVFLNRLNEPLTRHGIYLVVERYARKAAHKLPSLAEKKVSPHRIRHTTACHLLKAGVDINTIRAWLGHVSLDTTNVYAEIDVEMKSRALAQCEITGGRSKPWREDANLMAFLKTL
jgi:site-specific recombinase XerD